MKNNIALVIDNDSLFYPKIITRIIADYKIPISCIYVLPKFSMTRSCYMYYYAWSRILGQKFLISYLKSIIIQNSPTLFTNRIKKHYSIKKCAESNDSQYIKITSVNSPKFLDSLNKKNIHIVFSATTQIFNTQLLNNDRIRFYNFHPGFLPYFKGRFSVFWAFILNGKQGMSCHEITAQIDEGKLINRKEIIASKRDTVSSVFRKMALIGAVFFKETLDKINNNDSIESKKENGFYGNIPTNMDIKKYKIIIKKNKL